MEQSQTEGQEQTVNTSAVQNDLVASINPSVNPTAQFVVPQSCSTCGTALAANNGGIANGPVAVTSRYIYAIGRIEARFPRPSVEKEFAQATGRAETAGLTDQQAFHEVLSTRENRYLARQLCFV